jgi:hypothetical protein
MPPKCRTETGRKWKDAEQAPEDAAANAEQTGFVARQKRCDSPPSMTAQLSTMDPRFRWFLMAVGVWIVGLLLLFVLGSIFSTLTLRSIERNSSLITVSAREMALRRMYRAIITVAGLYYYISLPMVILLLVMAEVSIVYAHDHARSEAIRNLLAMLAVGPILTLFDIIRSLVVRGRGEKDRLLTREEAPAIWTLAEDVAERVGTRPFEQIRLTWGSEIGVEEKGTRKDKAHDKADRILVLGVAALNGFRTNAFRAALAHEYGHFMHRDTASGMGRLADIHMANVRSTMGKLEFWNVGLWLLYPYTSVFRRITRGALRLQEVLADRTAALNYGADAFEEGLRHVIRRSVEFTHLASKEIDRILKHGWPMQNLYDLVPTPEDNASIEAKIDKTLRSRAAEDDTHPIPLHRFHFVHQMNRLQPATDDTLVWDLFKDRAAITTEMTKLFARPPQGRRCRE